MSGVFIGASRCTGVDHRSWGVWRVDTQRSKAPKDPGRVGAPSAASGLTGAPRLTGVSQGQRRHWRRETQMSVPPTPPVRFETKYRACSSGESAAFASLALELTIGPRFTGSDHSEVAKRLAWMPSMCGSESVVQATNNALVASAASPAGYLVVMEPPR